MAKCVRWLQSQTVLEVEERLVFLVHPCSDQLPIARIELLENIGLVENYLYQTFSIGLNN